MDYRPRLGRALPRPLPLHALRCIVTHRRAGNTVACIGRRRVYARPVGRGGQRRPAQSRRSPRNAPGRLIQIKVSVISFANYIRRLQPRILNRGTGDARLALNPVEMLWLAVAFVAIMAGMLAAAPE
jgi:hypothetical protein